jgi:hypothetical protein
MDAMTLGWCLATVWLACVAGAGWLLVAGCQSRTYAHVRRHHNASRNERPWKLSSNSS